MSDTNISDTFYNEYFDSTIKDIYLVDKLESSELWTLYIDEVANTFFRLSDDNSIISNSKNIGDWRQYYDNDDISGIQKFLISKINWNRNDLIIFFINKETAIKTNYGAFIDNVFNFIELNDDCPIIVNLKKGEKLEYFYYSSFGNIFYSSINCSKICK